MVCKLDRLLWRMAAGNHLNSLPTERTEFFQKFVQRFPAQLVAAGMSNYSSAPLARIQPIASLSGAHWWGA